jgi:PPOX class probable F420-dependent enzyme
MYTMSRDQWREFVSTGTRTGKLAIVRSNGAPLVVPIWFVLDTDGTDDFVVFNTGRDSVKGKILRRDPRFCLCVDEEAAPYSYVSIQGEATMSDDLDEMLTWSIKLGARYMGAERGEEFGRRNAVPEEVLVRGRVLKVNALGALAE